MSLMVDIGGGTTDISFFTIEKEKPQVYRFKSINKGLNYLTDADAKNDTRHDSNVKDDSEINANRQSAFTSDLNQICINLREDLKKNSRSKVSCLFKDLQMHSVPVLWFILVVEVHSGNFVNLIWGSGTSSIFPRKNGIRW